MRTLSPEKDVVLSLNSNGGLGFPFYKFEDIIKEHTNPKRKIITHVALGAECTSYCLFLYMLGQVRTAAPNAKFGFHAGSSIITSKTDSRREAVETFVAWGVNKKGVDGIADKGILDSAAVTYLTPSDLGGSGIVEHVITDEPE